MLCYCILKCTAQLYKHAPHGTDHVGSRARGGRPPREQLPACHLGWRCRCLLATAPLPGSASTARRDSRRVSGTATVDRQAEAPPWSSSTGSIVRYDRWPRAPSRPSTCPASIGGAHHRRAARAWAGSPRRCVRAAGVRQLRRANYWSTCIGRPAACATGFSGSGSLPWCLPVAPPNLQSSRDTSTPPIHQDHILIYVQYDIYYTCANNITLPSDDYCIIYACG